MLRWSGPQRAVQGVCNPEHTPSVANSPLKAVAGMLRTGTPPVSGPRVWRPVPPRGKVASVWKQDTVSGNVVLSGGAPLWKGLPSTLTMWGKSGQMEGVRVCSAGTFPTTSATSAPLCRGRGMQEGSSTGMLCAYLDIEKLDVFAESRTAKNCPSPPNVFYLGLRWTTLGLGHWLPFPAPLPMSGHWEFARLSSVFLSLSALGTVDFGSPVPYVLGSWR